MRLLQLTSDSNGRRSSLPTTTVALAAAGVGDAARLLLLAPTRCWWWWWWLWSPLPLRSTSAGATSLADGWTTDDDADELVSNERRAARLATISSISLRMAPSAATSDELLSSPSGLWQFFLFGRWVEIQPISQTIFITTQKRGYLTHMDRIC